MGLEFRNYQAVWADEIVHVEAYVTLDWLSNNIVELLKVPIISS